MTSYETHQNDIHYDFQHQNLRKIETNRVEAKNENTRKTRSKLRKSLETTRTHDVQKIDPKTNQEAERK